MTFEAGRGNRWDRAICPQTASVDYIKVLSGACGIVYGCNVVWQMYDCELFKRMFLPVAIWLTIDNPSCYPVCGTAKDMSWKKSIHLPGPAQLQLLVSTFTQLPTHISENRQPRQDLVISTNCPVEWQDRDGRIDVMADHSKSLASWLIAHSGRGYSFALNLKSVFAPRDTLSAEWLNPRTAERSEISAPSPAEAVKFEPPTQGSVASDWVLIILRV